jgi:hypothetical protein
VREVTPGVTREQLHFERSMKAFLLALSLRMIRPSVQNAHAQSQQPDGERSIPGPLGHVAPRGTFIAEDGLGQSVTLERGGYCRLHRLRALIIGGIQHQVESRMIVEYCQRMTPLAALRPKLAFVIGLPEFVGSDRSKRCVAPEADSFFSRSARRRISVHVLAAGISP